ncbi:Fic family protein [Eubacterium sp. 1001713B170207_170306_E7]|uniref:Fic family protein n=1 Tax=Eubacterium sp. 1001713B170207_170306_E7 TaxID=2787097 RepID=UPI00189A8645|nr:Fic family protein [Eubacterium sp. 1001713B170207_170306_E7]
MKKLLQSVDALNKKLNSLKPLNETELKRLRDEFAIENTYNSNAIEGNSLTLKETALILQEGITISKKPLREHLDIIGFKDGFDFIMDCTESVCVLTEELIKNIHALVLINDARNRGVFRKVPVQILASAHHPTQPYLIKPYMQKLIQNYSEWLKESPTIEAIARFHLEFESIHPFIDGNGRTGRLILNLELVKHGYLPVDIKVTDAARYYKCFDDYRDNDLNPEMMTELIAEYEKSQMEKHIAIVEAAQEYDGEDSDFDVEEER